MWNRALSIAVLIAAAISPAHGADAPGTSRVHGHLASSRARVTDVTSPTTWIYGLCTFPTPEGLERTCSTQAECSDVAAGERWQAGCWFR